MTTPQDPQSPNPTGPRSTERRSPANSGIKRRDFLKQSCLSSLALGLVGNSRRSLLAGDGSVRLAPDHFIPVDKQLRKEWIKSLYEKREAEWYSGSELNTIGMPVGGLCAGQVYLTGEGRLAYWDIFNQNVNTGYGRQNWKEGRGPELKSRGGRLVEDSPVRQGFALRVRQGTRTTACFLDRAAFPETRFRGEYPLGTVEYRQSDFPVDVVLEAFSPFIPLNASDSALPATILRYRLRNTSTEPMEITLAGWLSNAVCRHSAVEFAGQIRKTVRTISRKGMTGGSLGAEVQEVPRAKRLPEVFADFENGSYDQWRVEGKAFGERPASGTLPGQQEVSGFEGRGLINTFLGGDKPRGRLISPEFAIERPFISFLIGGGSDETKTCMNLVVDGKVVRSAAGKENERLTPRNWEVQDLIGKQGRLEIVDDASGAWGHINIDHIEFRDDPVTAFGGDLRRQPDYGSTGLFHLGDREAETIASLPDDSDAESPFEAADQFGSAEGTTVRTTFQLRSGEAVEVPFVVTWHMPNLYRGGRWVGNYYSKRFRNAVEVAAYVRREYGRLTRETRLWHDTYYDSTLPTWLLNRLHSTAANLATTTAQWWRDGRFWAWEGGGCCHGTCGHVWNYEHTLARLFPELERSVREMQDFADGVGMQEEGSIGFRGEGWTLWAGDSQGGYVLKALREHQCSADDTFLNRNWRQIRRATEFLIEQDGDADGLIEGAQHQTYDQDYYGANTFVGSMYLGALRAAARMAREVGDTEFAERCAGIAEKGGRFSVDRLFNGEYFIQEVDLEKHPDWQYGEGCLADQLFGQGWAHQVGLGYLYPPAMVRKTLTAIWKYCWAPDITPQNEAHAPERWFASKGDAGLFTCTWPRSKHLGPRSTRYRNELWTGIEYQVAGHMAWEGLVQECLAICRAIHDRYHPARFNPWNEIECGDHYARALASWGVLIGLSGFEYDGPKGHLGFGPRLDPHDFKAAFTAAEGWGTLRQRREQHVQVDEVTVKWGEVRLQNVAVRLAKGETAKAVEVSLRGGRLGNAFLVRGRTLTVRLHRSAVVAAGDSLRIRVETGPS